jgi:hypothetical protein
LLFDPILPVPDPGLAETRLFVVVIPEFAASKLDNFDREVMADTVDVVR